MPVATAPVNVDFLVLESRNAKLHVHTRVDAVLHAEPCDSAPSVVIRALVVVVAVEAVVRALLAHMAVERPFVICRDYGHKRQTTRTVQVAMGCRLHSELVEAGTFPTSYIPTSTAATTRAADAASMTGTNFSEWYRQDEGTFVVGFDAPNIPSDTATYCRVYSAHGGTNANSIDMLINGGWNPDRIVAMISAGGVASFDPAGTANGWVAAPVAYAVNATAYKADSFATSWNGLAAATDSAGALPVVNQLNIGGYLSASQLNGHIRSITYYPKRLANAELQALTA